MGLSVSRKFWSTKLSLSSRLCFASGFLFYLHHVAISIVAPAMLVVLIYLSPDSFDTIGYGLVAPWLLLSLVVLPLWHRPTYRFDILTVRLISSWAYLFAAVDLMRGRSMAWQATGAKSQSDWRFKMAKLGVLVWNGGCGFVLMGLSIWSTLHSQTAGFGPIFLLGLTYCVMAGRIVKLSTQIPQATANLVIPLPREEMMPVAITPEQNLEVA